MLDAADVAPPSPEEIRAVQEHIRSIEAVREVDHRKALEARALRLHALFALPAEEQAQALQADRALSAHSEKYFINNWCWLRYEHALDVDGDPASRLVDVPFVLWPSQEELVEWFGERTRLGQTALVPKSRAIGATWLTVCLRLHAMIFRGASTLVLSRKEALVDRKGDMDSIFEKARYELSRLPTHLKPRRLLDNHLVIKDLSRTSGQGEITGESTNAGSGRGGRKEACLMDEFAQTPAIEAERVWRSTKSVARSRWVLYNPNGKGHKTAQLFRELEPEQVKVMPWQVDPYRDEIWRKGQEIQWGGDLTSEEAAVEFDCDHSTPSGFRVYSFQRGRVAYRESTPEWQALKPEYARTRWAAPGGWDFGSGHSYLVCVQGLVEWTDKPELFRLWVDSVLWWDQQDWTRAAADFRSLLSERYGGRRNVIHFGDPAGQARDSSQQSWYSNLQAGGVPVYPLPAAVNAGEVGLWRRRLIQRLLTENRIRIHEEYCPSLIDALDAWRLDVPEGVASLHHVNKAHISPRKDSNSHFGEAFGYLVDGVVHHLLPRILRSTETPDPKALSGAGSRKAWGEMYRKLLRAGR